MTSDDTLLHATTVAIDGQGVLIVGPSGTGKSGLALRLIALGGVLVADDQTSLKCDGQHVLADAPVATAGLIEARGVGLIKLPHNGPTPLTLVIDLAQVEAKRLPEPHQYEVLGQNLPCLHKVESPHFPSAIVLYIKGTLES